MVEYYWLWHRSDPPTGATGKADNAVQPSMLPHNARTDTGLGLPKYARVAAAVRRQIADGILRPGQPAPSGAALSRVTGYSTLTCRRALRVLVADGVLTPGPSRNARPRVAGVAQQPAERDLAAAARALSSALAGRRHASGLTQPELARRAGVSVTTIGHAETGRLWQSRDFWERADSVLGGRGDLLRLHDAYRAAGTSGAHGPGGGPLASALEAADAPSAQRPAAAGRPGDEAVPACVTIMWSDGTTTTVRPPQPPVTQPPVTQPPVTQLPGVGPSCAEASPDWTSAVTPPAR
jgi:DNA-binding GntR family transcriptional regulator